MGLKISWGSLRFDRHPGEVEGEEIYVASRGGVMFWVSRGPHETTWTWIATNAADGCPLDLGTNLPTKDAAIRACNEWEE